MVIGKSHDKQDSNCSRYYGVPLILPVMELQAKDMNSRPCVICGSLEHTQFYCRMKKRKPITTRKPINRRGKIAKQWQTTRDTWFKRNPAEYYFCYICGKRMTPNETTLDHVNARSRAPERRFDASNLKPCCYLHNLLKASKSIEEFLEIYPEFKSTVRL